MERRAQTFVKAEEKDEHYISSHEKTITRVVLTCELCTALNLSSLSGKTDLSNPLSNKLNRLLFLFPFALISRVAQNFFANDKERNLTLESLLT